MLEIVIETHSNKITYLVVLRLVRPPAVVFVHNGSVLLWRQQSQLSLQQYRIHGAWNCAAIINSPDNSECHHLVVGDNNVFTARRSYASAVLGVVILSVCPSVRPSVYHTHALWLIQRTYRRHFYNTWSAIFLVFWRQRSRRNSNGVTPAGGAK